MAGFHIIAGSKANIRSALMDKEDTAKALKMERRLEEKSKTSSNGDGSSRVNAGQINQIETQANCDKQILPTEEKITTLADKIHQGLNETTARNQGTKKTIVGKRMVNQMVIKALPINCSGNKTMVTITNVHTAE